MALIVGNLLTDPAANSFISISDAISYLTDEASGALPPSGLGQWMAAGKSDQESCLVRASRWMAVSLRWRRRELSDEEIARVGRAAARLAVHALTVDLWGAESVGKAAKRYKAGSVEVEYQDSASITGLVADGKRFPWLNRMLGDLVGGGGQHWLCRF